MRAVFIYIGVALAILATFILVFKPEFATVSTPLVAGNYPNARIMGVTEGGDIYLSNNTVSNINTLFQGTNDSLKLLGKEVAALQKESATKTALATNTAAIAAAAAKIKLIFFELSTINKEVTKLQGF